MLGLCLLLIVLLRVRLDDLLVGLVALWLLVLWFQTATYTLMQAAAVLGVVGLVATMLAAECACTRRTRCGRKEGK